MTFKNILILGLSLTFSLALFSKNIYLKYDPACMDRYEYRLNGNMAGNGLISYYLKGNNSERIMMEIGVESIKQVKRMPRGTKSCGKVKVNDLFANSVNSGKDKVYIVRKVGGNYIVSPVHLATYMKDRPNGFAMIGNQFDFDYSNSETYIMENNLAGRDSPTKVYFTGSEQHNCLTNYIIKKIPEETCKPYTDLSFIPGIGIVQEKTGTNQAEADQNILLLVKINGISLGEYLEQKCDNNLPEVKTRPEEMVEESPVFSPATTNKPTVPTNKPASYEVLFPVETQPIAPEYTPASDEIVYNYNKPQKPAETFRPKGAQCKELSYEGIHIVQTGQTLYSVSRKYGVTVNQLRTWNKMGKKDLIKPCESLYVLPPATVAANAALPSAANAASPSIGNNDEFTAKGNNPVSAEILYRNTPNNTSAPKGLYANAAKRSEVLYPKSGNIAPTTAKSKKDGCTQLSYDGVHIIKKGETLYSIAKQNDITVDQLEKWNKLSKNSKIKPCTSLYIKTPASVIAANNAKMNPSPANNNYTIPNSEINTGYTNAASNNTNVSKGAADIPATNAMWNSGIEQHIVQKGETLTSLAKMYGFTVERFRDINGLGDSNIIRIGQVLRTGNCLCPVNEMGVNNNNTKAINTGNTSGNSGVITNTNNKVVSNDAAVEMTTKGGGSNTTTERVLDYSPVPAPYDYETASIITNSTQKNTSISTRNGRKVHTVQQNETLATIANKYNITIKILRKLNNMEKGEVVIPDLKIYLE